MSNRNHRGFTFIELVIVMGIIVLLSMIATYNFYPIKQRVSLDTTIQVLISDLKEQQSKAMNGLSVQGIFFNNVENNYVIFQGDTYDPNNTTNFRIPLGDNISISSVDFNGEQIIFAPLTGEISSFNNSLPLNKIILLNTTSNQQKELSINKFGVITNVSQ